MTTFKSFTSLSNNENIVVIADDKESCTVILKKLDYINKINKRLMKELPMEIYRDKCHNTCRFKTFPRLSLHTLQR